MKKLLVVGLPFFAKKYSYMVDTYLSIGVHPKLLINSDYTNYSKELDIEFSSKNTLKRMCKHLSIILKYKPSYIDCYDYSILTIYYLSIAKVLGVETRLWLIGGELKGDTTHFNKKSLFLCLFTDLKKKLTVQSLNLSDKILVKELHHLLSIENINEKLLEKVVFIHNAVPTNKSYNHSRQTEKDFIYANAVIETHNVNDLISVFCDLKEAGVVFSASIYGFNSISNEVYLPRGTLYSDTVLQNYNKSNIKDTVTVHGFVKNIESIMLQHRFFVLPANVIFANYALLEAMALGLVPIIYPGDGYEKIVTDGVNGIVATDYDLQSALERALSLSEAEYQTMSEQAYLKIKSEFSIAQWAKKLSDIL